MKYVPLFLHKKARKKLKIEDKIKIISLFWNELLIITLIDHHYQSPILLLVTFKKEKYFLDLLKEKWAHFLIYIIQPKKISPPKFNNNNNYPLKKN